MVDQVNQFSNSIAKKPSYAPWNAQNAVAGVWIGVNDVGNSFYLGNMADITERAVSRYFELLKIMYNAGLRKFVLLSVPRKFIDRICAGISTDSVLATQLTPTMIKQGPDSNAMLVKSINLYNSKIASKLQAFEQANSGVKAVIVDTSVSFNKAIKNPTAYGAPDATCFNNNGKSCVSEFAQIVIVFADHCLAVVR